MTRKTTTKQLSKAITNNLLQVKKAEVQYKTSRKTDVITDSFFENFQFLCESGCFIDCIGWTFDKDYKTNDYICETGRMNGSSENIVTAYLHVCEGVNVEDIEKILLLQESEES